MFIMLNTCTVATPINTSYFCIVLKYSIIERKLILASDKKLVIVLIEHVLHAAMVTIYNLGVQVGGNYGNNLQSWCTSGRELW